MSSQWAGMEQKRPKTILNGLEVVVVFTLALAMLSAFISPTPHIDEFYHVLAAQAYNRDGTLVINPGGDPYTRARAFTYTVAACERWFGEGWASARLPSLAAGALLVAAVFGWLHRAAGRRAAWIGAVLITLAPDIIAASSMVRFYIPHAFFIWLTLICAYAIVTGIHSARGRFALGVLGTGAAVMAMHLQETTAIIAVVALVWLATEFVGWLARCEAKQRRKAMIWLVAAIVIIVPAAWAGLAYTGMMAHLIDKINTPRLWSLSHRDEVQYYHRFLSDSYPLLWALFPFVAIAALAHRGRPAWFCLVLFAGTFLIHSLLPFKAARYLIYGLPCFFALWAIALDGMLLWLHQNASSVLAGSLGTRLASRRWVDASISLLLLGGLLFAAMVSPAYKLGRQMLLGQTLGPAARENWALVAATLKPIADQTGFVVCSSPPKAVYYLGRHDVALSVSQAAGRAEFQGERIMGRPVITTSESLRKLMQEHPSGLIVIESAHFGVSRFVPTEAALFIEAHTRPIDIPGETGVKAFYWVDAEGSALSDQAQP